MSSKHSFFVAAACALPLSLAACGSSSSSDAPIIPEGSHYGYVVSGASVPVSDKDVTSFGLDLGSKTSSKPDGSVDNQLGHVFVTLSSLMFNLQKTVTTAIDQGSIILLIDLQTKDLANSSAAGFSVKIGANPVPPACDLAGDTICRHQLDGHGAFQIAAGSPTDAVVAGKIVSGAFTGGPGDVALQIAIGTTTPISLNLLHARVQATINPTDNTLTAIIGGLVTQSDLMTQLGPVLQAQIMGILTAQCTPGGPGTCGCPTGSTAALLLGAGIDTDANCMISVPEIFNFSIVKTELQPDACSMDSCKTADSLSIGLKVQAVKAAFPGVM